MVLILRPSASLIQSILLPRPVLFHGLSLIPTDQWLQCCASHWHVIDRHDPTNFASWFKSFVQSTRASRAWKNGIQWAASPECPRCACHDLASRPCHVVVNDCGVFQMGHVQLPCMVFPTSLDCSKSIKSTCQVTVIRWRMTCWLGFSHWLSNTARRGEKGYSPWPGWVLGGFYPSRGYLFYTRKVIYRKSITILIRTPDVWASPRARWSWRRLGRHL